MENGYQNLQEIHHGNVVGTLRLKSNLAIPVLATAGILSVIFLHNLLGIVFGAVCIVPVLLTIKFVPGRDVMIVCDDCLILLNTQDQSFGRKILLDQIEEWNNNYDGKNMISLKLCDGSGVSTMCCQTATADKLLGQVLSGKSTYDKKIQMMRASAEKISLRNITHRRKHGK